MYLLCARRTANRLTAILLAAILTASVCVLLAPIDYARVESFRLSGKVIEWRWVRMFSPFINLYAASFLIGGAVASGLRYRQQPDMRHRFLGNPLIAAGALLPGIGGTFTRFGHTEVLYVTELVGIVTIYLGYRTVTDGPSDHLTVRAMDTLAPSGTSRTCAGRS